MEPWIGVDLDGTLAVYDHWRGTDHIGPPIEAMVRRVRHWLEHGHPEHGQVEVRIVTARVATPNDAELACEPIHRWCEEHLGRRLAVTHEKDYGMLELWDDRCVQVEPNTGRRMDGQPDLIGGPA